MPTFEDVEIIKEANIYFDGKVTSRVVKFNDGATKTLGIMMPGSFEFSTEKHELMEIMAGELNVLLPEIMLGKLSNRESLLKCLHKVCSS